MNGQVETFKPLQDAFGFPLNILGACVIEYRSSISTLLPSSLQYISKAGEVSKSFKSKIDCGFAWRAASNMVLMV